MPSVAIAQAALESGYGKTAHKSLYGIKGSGNQLVTHEYINGVKVKITDSFKASSSIQNSVKQYADFLNNNKRYSDVLSASDPYKQTAELQKAEYATDPNYASKLNSIINKYSLTSYDSTLNSIVNWINY